MTGIELISKERQEQIEKHGRTLRYDESQNDNSELCDAAHALLLRGVSNLAYRVSTKPYGWDESIWLRMCQKPYRARLIIAGALIAAEIDRLKD